MWEGVRGSGQGPCGNWGEDGSGLREEAGGRDGQRDLKGLRSLSTQRPVPKCSLTSKNQNHIFPSFAFSVQASLAACSFIRTKFTCKLQKDPKWQQLEARSSLLPSHEGQWQPQVWGHRPRSTRSGTQALSLWLLW